MTIISHAVTLIPAVHNENGDNETCEDDNYIYIEGEGDKIICKNGIKLTMRTCWGLLPIISTFD